MVVVRAVAAVGDHQADRLRAADGGGQRLGGVSSGKRARRGSVPISSGAAITAHMLKCDRYSVSVMRPLPTSSMSGSFQCPGPAYWASGRFCLRLDSMLDQLSLMSPVVRHRLPTSEAHNHGWFRPHSQMLKTMGRPVAFSASRIVVYRCLASTPWLWQLSHLR